MRRVRTVVAALAAALILQVAGCALSGNKISVDKTCDVLDASGYERYGNVDEFLSDSDNRRAMDVGIYVRSEEKIKDLFENEELNSLFDHVDEEFLTSVTPKDANEIVFALKTAGGDKAYANTCFFCCVFDTEDDADRYLKSKRDNIRRDLENDKNKKTDVSDLDELNVNIISAWRKYALNVNFVRSGKYVYVMLATECGTNDMRDIVYGNCEAMGIIKPALDDIDCTKASGKGDRMLLIREELNCEEIDMSEVKNGNMYKDDYKGKVLYYETSNLEEMEYIGYTGDKKFEDVFVQGEVIYGRTSRRIQMGVGSYRVFGITLDNEEAAGELYESMLIAGFDDYDKDEGEKDGIRYCKYTRMHEQVVMSFYFYQEGPKIYQLFAWESLEDSYEDVITRNIEIMGLP